MQSSVMALFDRLKTLYVPCVYCNLANDLQFLLNSYLIYNEEITSTNYYHLNVMHNGRKKQVRVLNGYL